VGTKTQQQPKKPTTPQYAITTTQPKTPNYQAVINPRDSHNNVGTRWGIRYRIRKMLVVEI
jgi:hypothetical protein